MATKKKPTTASRRAASNKAKAKEGKRRTARQMADAGRAVNAWTGGKPGDAKDKQLKKTMAANKANKTKTGAKKKSQRVASNKSKAAYAKKKTAARKASAAKSKAFKGAMRQHLTRSGAKKKGTAGGRKAL